jgi:hypothetical protein
LAETGRRHRAQRCPPAIHQDRASAIETRQGRDKHSAGSVTRSGIERGPKGTPECSMSPIFDMPNDGTKSFTVISLIALIAFIGRNPYMYIIHPKPIGD